MSSLDSSKLCTLNMWRIIKTKKNSTVQYNTVQYSTLDKSINPYCPPHTNWSTTNGDQTQLIKYS